ncbi:MAG: hypothetical protein V4633_01555, partial [Pseudomonadota bacterium]
IQQSVWVVLQQIIGVRIAVHINADLVCHDVVNSYCELLAWSNADFACSYNCRIRLANLSGETLFKKYTQFYNLF